MGRLHNPNTLFPGPGADEFNLVNYQWFINPANPSQLLPGFHDPERPGFRTPNPPTNPLNLATPRQNWLCGFNAPYTYADFNNMYLAVVDSSGNVLQPSYHRSVMFGALDNISNPNWTNAVGKYLTLRPRPQEKARFPFPEDSGGDVKNLLGNPGGNDSIWTDLGSPVRIAPNGKTYKAMFAPLIVELDSRLNLGAHGNNLGGAVGAPGHISNTGWGPWSVNLAQVLKDYTGGLPAGTNAEWGNIFTGSTPTLGRYGSAVPPGTLPLPGVNGNPFPGSIFPIPANQMGLFPVGLAAVFPAISGKGYSKTNFDEGSATGSGSATVRSLITTPLHSKHGYRLLSRVPTSLSNLSRYDAVDESSVGVQSLSRPVQGTTIASSP